LWGSCLLVSCCHCFQRWVGGRIQTTLQYTTGLRLLRVRD
jgi:hypothetical protein